MSARINKDQIALDFTPAHPQQPAFDGATYSSQQDKARLNGQMLAVFNLMKDGVWRTLAEIHAVVKGSEAGISARLRDLRKDKWGAHSVERRRRGNGERGLHEYSLSVRIK